MDILIGTLLVMLVAFYRFNTPPPSKPSLSAGVPQAVGTVLSWFRWKEEPPTALFPPPRANTTLFKFWLYRTVYVVSGLAVYGALLTVSGLQEQVFQVILPLLEKLSNPDEPMQFPHGMHVGPVALAVVVAVIFPRLPPLKGAEASIRRFLYERAAIPAQQLRERNRLREAAYEVKPAVLEAVRTKLVAEKFAGADLVYEQTPTVQSLWTKAALLMEHMAAWRTQDKYMTAFAVLKERDSDTLSIDRVDAAYEALKGDAKACFSAIRHHPGEPETEAREAAFRQACKELLGHIYDLLSRVSLQSHFTERERIACMHEIGFKLTPDDGGPIPDINDLFALAMILSLVLVFPLAARVGFAWSLGIGLMTYTTVLTPILIACHYPRFALAPESRTPPVAFPVVAGLLAAALGILIYATCQAIDLGSGGLQFDFSRSWTRYKTRSYPWSTLLALLAFLIACQMRTGTYPETSRLQGFARYREWGNLKDAVLFAGAVAALMIFFILPEIWRLRDNPSPTFGQQWRPLGVATALAFTTGFLVPTWYRANLLRMRKTPRAVQGVLPDAGNSPDEKRTGVHDPEPALKRAHV